MSVPAPEPQPGPEQMLRSLMNAGVSKKTAKAMAAWKAREVLDLLAEQTPPPGHPDRSPSQPPGDTI